MTHRRTFKDVLELWVTCVRRSAVDLWWRKPYSLSCTSLVDSRCVTMLELMIDSINLRMTARREIGLSCEGMNLESFV